MNRIFVFCIVLFFAGLVFSSCATTVKIAQKFYSPYDKTMKRAARLTKDGKEVLLVPMCHLGTEAHYAKVKNYLDSLKSNGYVVFFETVFDCPFHIDTTNDVNFPQLAEIVKSTVYTKADSMRMDTLNRKFRRITGFHLGRDGYKEQDNETLDKKWRTSKYVQQDIRTCGLTTERDIWVDYTQADLTEVYEKQYGPTPLTDYDFETDLKAEYRPDEFLDVNPYAFMSRLRELYLTKRILTSSHDRIAVVYGEGHTRRLKIDLRFHHGYELDKKYKVPKHQR